VYFSYISRPLLGVNSTAKRSPPTTAGCPPQPVFSTIEKDFHPSLCQVGLSSSLPAIENDAKS